MNKLLTVALSAMLGASAIPALAQTSQTMPTCAAGDPVVWENSSSKVYHTQGDSYYGKTKHGAYACKSAADSAGYHLSGSSKKASAKASPSAMSGAATASPAATTSKHHHHHHSSSSPSPMSGVPIPAATGPAPAPAST